MFHQLQDPQLMATSGGALPPTSLQFEAFAAAREQGVYLNECSATWSEWTDNYIQTHGTPKQLEEIAERERRNARQGEIYMKALELRNPGFWTNFSQDGRR